MKVKFKLTIGVTSAILIIATAITIIIYNYTTSRKIIYEMADQNFDKQASIISEKLNSLFYPVEQQTKHLSDIIIDKDYMKNGKRKKYLELMWEYMNRYKQIDFIYIADVEGNWTQVRKEPWLATRLINRDKNIEIWEFRDKNYNIINRSTEEPQYDHRVRKWYKNVANEMKAYWTEPYIFQSIRKPGITISYPLIDKKSAKKFGVISSDITLDDISKFLKAEKTYETELSYIVSKSGNIVAYSDIDFSNSEYRLINTNINSLNSQVGEAFKYLGNSTNASKFFQFNGDNYFGKISNIMFQNVEYRLVIVVKENEIFGGVNETLKNSILLSILVLLVALFLLIKLINRISTSIQKLTVDAEKLTDLNFYSEIPKTSIIYEVYQMQTSLESLRTAMNSFTKYIPFNLVTKMINNNIEAKLGGEKKEITLMFTDIENFTRISEEKEANDLVKQLSDYFGEISEIVSYTEGVVDKFIGDGTMSFWGAPLNVENHTIKACKAALECQKMITELNTKWKSENKPVLKTRIGINTGYTVVGNVGSNKRMNYTAMGDSVNITARLEALCKVYGVEVIISEETYLKVKDEFFCRPLGLTSLKGKKEKMMVYQLVEERHFAESHPEYEMHNSFTKHFLAYLDGEIYEVLNYLSEHIKKYPNDKSAEILYSELSENKI